MARGNYFKPNGAGYLAVLNGPDARAACEGEAAVLAVSASYQSGIDYAIDSIRGLTRIHTRVSTSGSADFYRERSYRALAIALGSAGGNVSGTKGYRSLAKAHKAAMRKHNKRAWKNSYDPRRGRI